MSTQKVAIVTDSSAYIPPAELQNLDVTIIPLWLIWEGESLQDGIDIDPPRFYQRLKTAKTLATTSQPTPLEFVNLFEMLAAKYDAIVNVLVSSKISGTYNSAIMAQEKLPDQNISVVDSQSSSMGLGLAVLAAAQAAAAGKSVSEIVQAAENIRSKMNFLFVVDTLEFLHRSGRIKASKRVLGTLLKVKPILHFKDGTI
jgi:DegV family protein with EDD domain